MHCRALATSWPTGRAKIDGATLCALVKAPGPRAGVVGWMRHAPAPVVNAPELARQSEARPGV